MPDTSEALENIRESGYAILPDLIDPEICRAHRAKLEASASRFTSMHARSTECSVHGLENKANEQVVYNLHNKDISWFQFFEHPGVTALLDVLLRDGSYQNAEPYYLNNISARCPRRGGGQQQLHIDSRIAGLNRCLVVNVLWMIDDFTAHNGGTRVVPGSHRRTSFAEDGKSYADEILITGRRGSALVFDAGLWHGGGENTDGASRWALALGYARWFVKPAFDFARNTPTSIYRQMNDRQRRLLGFDSLPPRDEFTRVRRRSVRPETPQPYTLPPLRCSEGQRCRPK